MSTSIVEKLRTLATPLGHTPAPEWVENELLSDAGLISRSTYHQFLAETYYHVKHTIGLVHLACETLAADNVG